MKSAHSRVCQPRDGYQKVSDDEKEKNVYDLCVCDSIKQ